MVWKIILIFLCAMVLIGMIGKLMFPGPAKVQGKCRSCGRPLIGRGPCGCRKGRS